MKNRLMATIILTLCTFTFNTHASLYGNDLEPISVNEYVFRILKKAQEVQNRRQLQQNIMAQQNTKPTRQT